MRRKVGVEPRRLRRRWPAAALLVLVLLAFGLRLFRLDHQSLWVDEATTAYLASASPDRIVVDRANNLHPPTYFLAVAGWTSLAGRSEFSLRFPTVWAGLLLVPLLYRLCRRLFADWRTGVLAASLAALSPAGVAYAQEARMYALLPVAYLVVLVCALAPRALEGRRGWFWLALSEIACLYLHFFSIFVVLAVNLLLLATRIRRASRPMWVRWVTSQAVVGLSYVPWLVAMWLWGTEVPAKLARRQWRAAGMDPLRFLRLLWDFLNTGLVGIAEVPALAEWLGVLGGLVALTLLLALLLDRRRGLLLALLGALLFPLLAAYPVWIMRPLAHPRYLLFLLAPLLAVCARTAVVLVRRPVWRALGVVLIVVIVSTDAAGLGLVFFDQAFFRHDMRSLAAAIADRAMPGEVVLMPPSDYSLSYYDPAPAAPVNLPGEIGAEGGRLRPGELAPLLTDRPGAFLVAYHDLRTADPRGQMPFLLEMNGRLVERFTVDRMDVDHYELGPDWALPVLAPVATDCPPVRLTGVYSQTVTRADEAVVVALRWRLMRTITDDLMATVRLRDGERRLAGADVLLMNELGRPISRWQAGEDALSFFVLPIPMGTAPLTYTLRVALYTASDGHRLTWETGSEWLELGPVRLVSAAGRTTDPYGSWSGVDWRAPALEQVAEGLSLDAYAVRPQEMVPGETFYVTMRWRALQDDLPRYAPALLLCQGTDVLARSSGLLFGRYPTDLWVSGELLIETRRLVMPVTLDPLELVLDLDGRAVPVGEVSVARDALLWEVPEGARPACARLGDVAELAGYEWTPVTGQPDAWQVILYWRAMPGAPAAVSYTVFTHLLSPEGVWLAQHDGLPDDGGQPTTIWLPGQIVADRHELLLDAPYSGPVRLLVGMYDLATMTRLLARDCQGQPLPEDAIALDASEVLEIP